MVTFIESVYTNPYMSNLSSEEKQKLAQFKEVTNFDDETQRDKVLRLLEVCNWNLDRACARYFDNDFPSLLDDRTSNDISHEATQMFSPPTRASSQIQFREAHSADSPFSIDQMNFDGRLLDIIPKLPRAMTIANKWKLNLGIAQPQLNGRDGGFTIFTPIVFVLMVIPKLLWALGWGLDRILGSTFPKLFHFLGFRDGPGDFPLKPMHETKEEISTYNVKDCIDNTLGETSDLHIFKG